MQIVEKTPGSAPLPAGLSIRLWRAVGLHVQSQGPVWMIKGGRRRMRVEGRTGFHAGPPGMADPICILPRSSTPIHCWISGSHRDTCLRFVEPQAFGRGREVIGSDKPQPAPGAA